MSWVCKSEGFFFLKYNVELGSKKVGIASIPLEGKAFDWFQDCEASTKYLNWKMFEVDITTQLGQGNFGQIFLIKKIFHAQMQERRDKKTLMLH